MTGGAGDDRYVFRTRAFFESNTETDTVDERDTLSSNGFDTLDFSALSADDPVNVFLNNPLQLAAHTKRIVRATVNNIGDFTRVEAAIGGRGDDTLGGEARTPNLLQGGPGDDHLVGGPETDTVGGIADQDTLEGGDGDDVLEGGAGNDVLDGGPGNDTLFGGPGINTWVFDGTTGDDFLNLTLQFPGSQNTSLFGTRRLTAGGTPVETDAASGIGILQVEGLDGNDTIDLSALGFAGPAFGTTVDGGAGNDTLIGSDRDETFLGGTEDDQMTGNGGDDTFSGGPGTGSASGGADNDTADATVETFDGGPGQDGIVVFGTDGNDRIRVSRRLGPNGPQAVVEVNGQTTVIDYLNGETVTVYAGAGNDHVVLDASATKWTAAFFGGAGNDHLVGGVLGDYLDGGGGNDELDGGDGDDTLVGGDGHDRFRGGAGADAVRADDGVADIVHADADDFLAVDVRDVVIRA
jgi:Ca2+-binding RTX toxin-like protein